MTSTAERHSDASSAPDITIIVVAICSIPQLRRSLEAIRGQDVQLATEIIVAADPRIGSVTPLGDAFPDVQFLSREGCSTPIELTTMALRKAHGARIVLTEDSCIASPGWLKAIFETTGEGRAAVGGVVEATPGITTEMWAFCYVDFFRYMRPATEGPSPTLSVCNVAYLKRDLDEVSDLWDSGFHETEVNSALQERLGPLWLCPDAEVRVRRDVTFGDAIYERYAFGRLFGATRIAHSSVIRRLKYAIGSPALPFLLVARMSAKANRDAGLKRQYRRAFPSILAMVLAWSWGEWLGYVTARRPRRINTAPEIQRTAAS